MIALATRLRTAPSPRHRFPHGLLIRVLADVFAPSFLRSPPARLSQRALAPAQVREEDRGWLFALIVRVRLQSLFLPPSAPSLPLFTGVDSVL